jgi:hypothetical protein
VHAPDDPQLLAGAIKALSVQDDANFKQIVDALQTAGCWDRQHVPDGIWLRWIVLGANEPGVEGPILAAQRLAQLPTLVDNPLVILTLSELIQHPEPDVRYNALCAAAALCGVAGDPSAYQHLITETVHDPVPTIAHHARLFAYLTAAPGADVPDGLKHLPDAPADEHYDRSAILNLLESPEAPLRDVGCVLAVRDLERDACDKLVAELLNEKKDAALMSGAVLSGLTGLRTDELREKVADQTDWATATVMKLGLWMQEDTVNSDIHPDVLLAREDIPRSTVILAMLHRHDPNALEVLLNPQGEAPNDLAALLDAYGWWRVLDRYLPADALRWRPGADPDQQQLQIDLLRNWYLVNRHRLSQTSAHP